MLFKFLHINLIKILTYWELNNYKWRIDLKFVKATDVKSDIMKFKNREPLKVRGRDVCAVHNDTDS